LNWAGSFTGGSKVSSKTPYYVSGASSGAGCTKLAPSCAGLDITIQATRVPAPGATDLSPYICSELSITCDAHCFQCPGDLIPLKTCPASKSDCACPSHEVPVGNDMCEPCKTNFYFNNGVCVPSCFQCPGELVPQTGCPAALSDCACPQQEVNVGDFKCEPCQLGSSYEHGQCTCSTGYAKNKYGNGCDPVQVDDKKSVKISKCIAHGYSWSTCEKNYGSYRHLKQVDARRLVEADDSKCSEADYNMYLVVHGAHFAGLATPKTSHSCPSVVFHAEASDSSTPMQKIALHAKQEDIDEVAEDAMLHLGVKSLADIVWAFENAPVGKTGTLYDAVSNNCVAMLRNMADPLEIPVDDRMVRFVTQKLLEGSTDHVFQMMKESPALSTIFNGGRRLLQHLDNHDLLANVIKLYA
jgi:hypothetical protein